MNSNSNEEDNHFLISYKFLRLLVGIIGYALTVAVIAYSIERLISGTDVLGSVSAHYYYPHIRDIFVGSLFAIGAFLLSYRGPFGDDKIYGICAGIAAWGVALLPTKPEEGATTAQMVVGVLHYISAVTLFGLFAAFCLVLFTKTNKTEEELKGSKKAARNKVYRFCGWGILIIMAILGAVALLGWATTIDLWENFPGLLIGELTMMGLFAHSWITKSETLFLKDPEEKSGIGDPV